MSCDNIKSDLSLDSRLEEILEWLNEIEFSRPKKILGRDFADGIFMAELLKKYYPRMVDLHNYPPANSIANKLKNWQVLNTKVLTPLGINQSDKFLKDVAIGSKGVVEHLLCLIKDKLEEAKKQEKKEMEQATMGIIVTLFISSFKYTLFNVFFLLITIPLLLLRLYNKKTMGKLVVQKRLDGKTVIITGGNVGLGFETAKELAYRGARVLLACKNIGSGHLAKSLIIKETRNDDITVYRLDLSSVWSVRNFAKAILEKEKRLDVLIFNAGIGFIKHERTADNLQLTWQVNCFSSFLLSNLLIDFMRKTSLGKIIFISSALHHFHWFNVDDIDSEKSRNAFMNHCNTKFATILMANFMAKKLEGTGIKVNTVNPGLVNVPLLRRVKNSIIQRLFQHFLNIYGKIVYATKYVLRISRCI
ncbi:retinol dehydrogenase 11-like isoform X3 [Rhodnius prolixus]|uniref:retinol dehydrogenase 11-like isoform X3 n=1 Tax=Rhodnius prolixus TaxID=13249 RepID=UPI003D18CBD2